MSYYSEGRAATSGIRQATNELEKDIERLLQKVADLEAELMGERAKVIDLEREVQRLESEATG